MAALAVLLAAWDATRQHAISARIMAVLDSWITPWCVAVITAIVFAVVWGDLSSGGAYHDERAYVLQARIFASGSWTWPAPPLDTAWEMAHVFVAPAIFPKYPPGHALLLVPGVWLGIPALVPVLLGAASAGLIFRLVRTALGPWVAFGTWLVWLSSPAVLQWHATYFSETTTAVAWVVALLALQRWVRDEATWSLGVMVSALAWMGITRPITAIALGWPIAIVIARRGAWRRLPHGWRSAAALGLAICMIIPVWNWQTLGHWSAIPYTEYSRQYFPFDMPGFVRDDGPPTRELPRDLLALGVSARAGYNDHVPARMPQSFVLRASAVLRASFGGTWLPMSLLLPIGLIALGTGRALLLTASWGSLLVLYLLMPHPVRWTVYYLELFAVAPAVALFGLGAALGHLRRRWCPTLAHVTMALGLVALTGFPGMVRSVRFVRAQPHEARLRFERALTSVPRQPMVVFIRPEEQRSPHFSVIDILGPPLETPVWIVRDLGDSATARLRAAAGSRVPYRYDERAGTLERMAP